jgi:hypothetical protein
MKADPSVGISAKNSTFTVKVEQLPAGSTTFTVAPIPPGAPVGGLTNDSPPAVIVAVISVGTPVCSIPVLGSFQLVVPAHHITVLEKEVNVIVCSDPSRPAAGNALDDGPQ